MPVQITLTPEQENAVLAAYGHAEDTSTSTPKPPEPPKMVIKNETFAQFYGFAFGTLDPDAGKDLPYPACSSANGLMTWKLYVGGRLAIDMGVSTYGGGFNIHTVQDELDKWDGQGYEDIIEKIEAMGLQPDDYAVFPQDSIRKINLHGVEWGEADWKLEMWQQGEVRFTMTGPAGVVPPNQGRFTLAESGPVLPLHYYWQ